ncbi:hypothetical protein Syun_017136 [Stephania yunnanensis]|uniref:Uncharacterized protein n=1 Tax=Stephania yunnanensis TaxID=152371 RepID=A0AAP0J6D5_9MAGN
MVTCSHFWTCIVSTTQYLHVMKLRPTIELSGLQGLAREKKKREKERSELRDLVGKNLQVLSQIEGIDLDMYKDTVLPRTLEQIDEGIDVRVCCYVIVGVVGFIEMRELRVMEKIN